MEVILYSKRCGNRYIGDAPGIDSCVHTYRNTDWAKYDIETCSNLQTGNHEQVVYTTTDTDISSKHTHTHTHAHTHTHTHTHLMEK